MLFDKNISLGVIFFYCFRSCSYFAPSNKSWKYFDLKVCQSRVHHDPSNVTVRPIDWATMCLQMRAYVMPLHNLEIDRQLKHITPSAIRSNRNGVGVCVLYKFNKQQQWP